MFHEKEKGVPALEASKDSLGYPSILGLDGATAAKMVIYNSSEPADPQHEVLNMKFALEHTTIPTPNVHMVVADSKEYGLAFVVMDYIHGRRLDHAWPQLSTWSKLRVAWILRSYVR